MIQLSSLAPTSDFPKVLDYSYLDAASISLTPKPVVDVVLDFQREVASGGTVTFDEEAETGALEGARAAAARLVKANRDEIAVLTSATEAMGALAWSLGLEKGVNIVTADVEFPSVTYPWIRVAKERGAEVRFAENNDGIIDERELCRLVDDRTRIVAISHVEFGTGQRFNIHEIAEVAHKRGAQLLVDATQSAGIAPVDVRKDDVDFLVSASYKWLLGPFGIAFLYLKREHYERLEPPLVGWRSTESIFDFEPTKLSYAKTARKFEYSTMNYAAAMGLAKAIQYLLNFGIERVLEHSMKLNDRLLDEASRLGAKALTPLEREKRAGIMSLRFPGHSSRAVADALEKAKVIISHRMDAIRFSPHVYNGEEDILKAVSVLRSIIRA